MATASTSAFQTAELVFAVTSLAAGTAACAAHGDAAFAQRLVEYYALVADTVRPADGRVVKLLGDGAILTFPPSRSREAEAAMRRLQTLGTALWQRLDPRCRVLVKMGVGQLVHGSFDVAGEERYDVFGDALNRLFKLPWDGDFVLTPELRARS